MDRLLELTRRAEREHFWFRGFRRFIAPHLARATQGRTTLSILDCGCGTGFNMQMLARHGRVTGMDLTASGLAAARETQTRLIQADATHVPFASRTFDLVTSFDVLQCVPDDGQAVREMARVLKPGGYWLATVAALEALRGDHSVLAEEVRRYSKASVRRLLRDAGLEPVRLHYAFGSTLPVMLAVRTAQRLVRGHLAATGHEIEVPPAPVNALFSGVVLAEAALARVCPLPLGSTLVVLARKP